MAHKQWCTAWQPCHMTAISTTRLADLIAGLNKQQQEQVKPAWVNDMRDFERICALEFYVDLINNTTAFKINELAFDNDYVYSNKRKGV